MSSKTTAATYRVTFSHDSLGGPIESPYVFSEGLSFSQAYSDHKRQPGSTLRCEQIDAALIAGDVWMNSSGEVVSSPNE
jgi:hypothetical protein